MNLIQRVLAIFLVMFFISICLKQQVRSESTDADNSLFIILAEQGDVNAQWVLGFMYDNGKGVPQDDQKALDWYKKAALQGLAEAQTNLGVMYAADQSALQDYAIAYSWFNLAALQGNELGRKNRNLILTNMSSSQIKEGQILSTALYEKIDNQAR